MQLKVKPLKGEEQEVDVDDQETIETLRVLVITTFPDFEDCEPEDVRLLFKGSELKDSLLTIAGVGIKEGDFVVLVGRKKKDAPPEPPAAAAAAVPAQAAAPAAAAALAAGAPGGPPPESVVEEICSMGFPRDQVLKALGAAYNNSERAVSFLVEGNIPAIAEDGPQQPAQAAPPATAAASPAPAPAGSSGWAQGRFGPQLLTKAGLEATEQALGGARCVLLYFSAHWCPPCQRFTPMLASAFNALGAGQTQVQVVFVSSDRDISSYMHYYGTMPWTALPFGTPQKEMLSAMYGVRGIPALVALDGQTGATLDGSARDTLARGGFNLSACCAGWGVGAAPAAAPAPTPEPAAPAAPPKKPEPPPVAIDNVAAQAALARVGEQEWTVQEAFFVTLLKVLNNILQNPGEAKFRSLKKGNAALQTKLFSPGDGAGAGLLLLAGFQESEEAISLPGAPDGRCTAVRDEVQTHADAQKMKELRRERDAKIAEEIKKDQGSQARYSGGGGEGGRMDLGAGRKPRSGG